MVDSKDASVRENAICVLSEIYKVVDEDIWRVVGQVPLKVKALLEQRKSSLETELNDMINAPPRDGTDLTLGLPDELLIYIVLLMSIKSIFAGAAGACKRWRTTMCIAHGAR